MIIKYTKEEYDNAKSEDKLPLQCEECGKIFYTKKKLIKFELKTKRGKVRFCSVKCSDLSHKKRHKLKCEECGKEIEVLDNAYRRSKTKRFYCSKSCAAKYNNKLRGKQNDKVKKKIKQTLLKHYRIKFGESGEANNPINNPRIPKRKEYTCHLCGKKYHSNEEGSTQRFCSKECSDEYRKNRKKYLSNETILKLREAGRHSAKVQEKNRRSKNEMYFCELCEQHFNNVKHNERLFNGWDADVIIEDAKIAVLWNGKWHYQKIKKGHSVQQVQNRDEIKIKEIKKCGYTPYVIKDMGKENSQFVEEQFKIFLDVINDQ